MELLTFVWELQILERILSQIELPSKQTCLARINIYNNINFRLCKQKMHFFSHSIDIFKKRKQAE